MGGGGKTSQKQQQQVAVEVKQRQKQQQQVAVEVKQQHQQEGTGTTGTAISHLKQEDHHNTKKDFNDNNDRKSQIRR